MSFCKLAVQFLDRNSAPQDVSTRQGSYVQVELVRFEYDTWRAFPRSRIIWLWQRDCQVELKSLRQAPSISRFPPADFSLGDQSPEMEETIPCQAEKGGAQAVDTPLGFNTHDLSREERKQFAFFYVENDKLYEAKWAIAKLVPVEEERSTGRCRPEVWARADGIWARQDASRVIQSNGVVIGAQLLPAAQRTQRSYLEMISKEAQLRVITRARRTILMANVKTNAAMRTVLPTMSDSTRHTLPFSSKFLLPNFFMRKRSKVDCGAEVEGERIRFRSAETKLDVQSIGGLHQWQRSRERSPITAPSWRRLEWARQLMRGKTNNNLVKKLGFSTTQLETYTSMERTGGMGQAYNKKLFLRKWDRATTKPSDPGPMLNIPEYPDRPLHRQDREPAFHYLEPYVFHPRPATDAFKLEVEEAILKIKQFCQPGGKYLVSATDKFIKRHPPSYWDGAISFTDDLEQISSTNHLIIHSNRPGRTRACLRLLPWLSETTATFLVVNGRPYPLTFACEQEAMQLIDEGAEQGSICVEGMWSPYFGATWAGGFFGVPKKEQWLGMIEHYGEAYGTDEAALTVLDEPLHMWYTHPHRRWCGYKVPPSCKLKPYYLHYFYEGSHHVRFVNCETANDTFSEDLRNLDWIPMNEELTLSSDLFYNYQDPRALLFLGQMFADYAYELSVEYKGGLVPQFMVDLLGRHSADSRHRSRITRTILGKTPGWEIEANRRRLFAWYSERGQIVPNGLDPPGIGGHHQQSDSRQAGRGVGVCGLSA